MQHGSYALVALGPRVAEIADDLRPLVPAYATSDEPALRLLGLALARLERAEAALERAAADDMGRLRSDALGWANAARRLLNDLGMTPTSRASLGLDVARVAAVRQASLERLEEDGRRLLEARDGGAL